MRMTERRVIFRGQILFGPRHRKVMDYIKSSKLIYIFCPICGDKAWVEEDHNKHNQDFGIDSVNIKGVYVHENVITPGEENELIYLIDHGDPWLPSQEGRAKQDFGPKVNFLARKVAVGNFQGFPSFAKDLLDRLRSEHSNAFEDFIPVEFCILEYKKERASYIRPHYDDKWVWGERLVTVNLLSDTVLRLTREFNVPPYEIVIRMRARSLLVISDEARYDWHHSINRYDIKDRRVALTWREFSREVVTDPNYSDFVTSVFAQAEKTKPM